jgi:hypothetical protein
VLALLLAIVGLLVAATTAQATSGAGYTTINSTVDGPPGTLCHNGNPNVNCNQYFAKQYVWINGGPDKNGLSDGTYFFAVLVPGTQPDPNDKPPNTFPKPRTDGNLSDDFDPYTNRTFTIKNGEIFSYAGTHTFATDTSDNNEKKIRLFPYSDTTNNGGVYILAICQLSGFDKHGAPVNFGYPVDPKTCKYDAFKIMEDETPPSCPPPTFSHNSNGFGVATQYISDAGGIDTIEIKDIYNLDVSPLVPGVNWFQGTTSTVHLTATEIVKGAGARIQIIVTDVGGNVSICDPVLTSVRARAALRGRSRARTYRVSNNEKVVTIHNGRPGLRRVTVSVNGKRFVARHLRAGATRRIRIASALHQGAGNRVTVSGRGPAGGGARIMIAG